MILFFTTVGFTVSIPALLKGGKAVKRLVGFREKDALKKELEAL